MNYNLAYHILSGHGELHFYRSLILSMARRLAIERITVQSEWLNYKKPKPNPKYNMSPYDPPDIQKETTYSSCVFSTLSAKNGALILHIVLYDGNLADGSPKDERCAFTLTLTELPEELQAGLNKRLNEIAQRQLDDEEALRKEQQLQERTASIAAQFENKELL